MAIPRPTFGPNGFITPPEPDVLLAVKEEINAAFGGKLNMADETPQGQLAISQAASIGNANDSFLFLSQMFDPAYSYGRYQDALARIYFISRKPSQPTIVQCVCSGLGGVIIPVGALAIAAGGQQYACMQTGTISESGTVTLPFAAIVPGPIPCLAGTLTQIYQAVTGWDSINNPDDGILGNDVESRAEFEERRSLTVAHNSIGSLPSILGAVLMVPDVVDAFVTENDQNVSQTKGGVLLVPNSLYVAVVGGNADAIARAIWSKKAPGCSYNGNTTVTVLDQSAGYVPPYPAYSVQFERPDSLPIIFSVVINDTLLVPADAETQIQNAIVNAFSGADGGQRAKIGATLFASRYYAPVAMLGPWAQIVSIKIGSSNDPAATFTAAVTGTTMTVSAVGSGTLVAGQTVTDATGGIEAGTKIVSQDSGTPGGIGSYTVSIDHNVGSRAMRAVIADLDEVSVNIDQMPTASIANIAVSLS